MSSCFEEFERLGGVEGLVDPVALRAEEVGREFQELGLVLDDEDGRRPRQRSTGSISSTTEGRPDGSTGSTIWTVVPSPGWESMVIVPAASTIVA